MNDEHQDHQDFDARILQLVESDDIDDVYDALSLVEQEYPSDHPTYMIIFVLVAIIMEIHFA